MSKFWYLATPYSKYRGGIVEAFRLAAENTGLLIRAGVPVFSPIVHTHMVAMICKIDPLDHKIWLPADQPMMDAAGGLIMLMADGWLESYGMGVELREFQGNRPVIYMTPGEVPHAKLLMAAVFRGAAQNV